VPDHATSPPGRGLLSKRHAIIAAALDLFVRQGYAATTLEDIATATPVSRQTVYNHFGDKETLFRAVIDTHLEVALGVLDEMTPDSPGPATDPEEYLDELARWSTAVFRDQRTASLRLLLQTERQRHPHLLELWRNRVALPIWSTLVSHLSRLTNAGSLHIEDPARAAGQFLALTVGTVLQVADLGVYSATISPVDESADLDNALRSSVRLFVRGYQPTDRRG
jgi:AcrR family transcriptional regulator